VTSRIHLLVISQLLKSLSHVLSFLGMEFLIKAFSSVFFIEVCNRKLQESDRNDKFAILISKFADTLTS